MWLLDMERVRLIKVALNPIIAIQLRTLHRFYRERLAECAEILRRAKLPPLGAGASE